MRRFISADQDAVVVSGRVPDLDSSRDPAGGGKARPRRSTRSATAHPGYEIAVTGLSAIAARNSASMIEKLNRGLTIEFALVAIFIGLAFRSVVVMFVVHPARHFPGGAVGHGAVGAGGGAAICERRCAHRVVRPWPERDHPLPQPPAAREQAGRQRRSWRSSAPPCWSARR